MSGASDIHVAQSEVVRKAFAAAIGYEMCGEGKRTGTDISYGVMNVFRRASSEPVLLAAFLEALNLDVTEGFLMFPSDNRAYFDRPAADPTDVPVLVVRPRGSAL